MYPNGSSGRIFKKVEHCFQRVLHRQSCFCVLYMNNEDCSEFDPFVIYVVVKNFDPHQDDDTCPSDQELPPINSQLSESIPEPPHPTFSESSFVPKILPSRSRIPPFQDLYPYEVFPDPKVPTPNLKLQQ